MRGRPEDQVARRQRVQAQPPDRQDPQQVGVGHTGHVPGPGPDPGDHPVHPGRDLVERLPVGDAVAEEVPPGPVLPDGLRSCAPRSPVVPFDQVGADLGVLQPGELGRPHGPGRGG